MPLPRLVLVLVVSNGAPPVRVPLTRILTSIGAESSADVRVPSLPARFAIVRRDTDGEVVVRHLPSGKSHALALGKPIDLDGVRITLHEERATETGPERLDVALVSDALALDSSAEAGLRSLVRTTLTAADADVGALLVLAEGEPSVAVAERRDGSPVTDALSLLSDTIVRDAFTAAEHVRIDDVRAVDRYRSLPSVVDLALRAVICMPLALEGRVLGVLYLGRSSADKPFASQLTRDLAVVCAMCVPLLVQWRRAPDPAPTPREGGLEGEHPSMVELRRLVARVAKSTLSVFIHGETGTGKEVVARALHAESARRDLPFVAVNCAALAENLLAAELFGVKKGAFTGALSDREGLVESARGGTLFLDEVGDMPPAMQAALLRVLERREVVRVGDTTPRPVDFRLVAATHRDLDEDAKTGRFRGDLAFRLREMTLELPPLRARGEDVVLLAHRFAKIAAQEVGERAPAFAEDALRRLREHPFPGNVRELRAAVRRAVVLADGGVVHERDLGLTLTRAEPVPDVPPQEGSLDDAWRAFAKAHAERALARAGGNREVAAVHLGVSVRTLYRLLKEG